MTFAKSWLCRVIYWWLWYKITFSYTLDSAGRIEMGLKSFTFIGLSIFGTGHTLATFQLSGKISFWIDEFIIWAIGEAISSATGLRNFTRILSQPLEQSFLNSDIIFFTSVYVVCCITKVRSFYVIFMWSKNKKLIKKNFYFILKLFSFPRYLNFYLNFLVMQKKRLD